MNPSPPATARRAARVLCIAGVWGLGLVDPTARLGVPPEPAVHAAPQRAAPRAHVRVVATGGTIAGRGDPGNVAGYRSGAIPIEELLAAVPGLDAVADVSSEQFSNVGSTSLAPADWLALAQC